MKLFRKDIKIMKKGYRNLFDDLNRSQKPEKFHKKHFQARNHKPRKVKHMTKELDSLYKDLKESELNFKESKSEFDQTVKIGSKIGKGLVESDIEQVTQGNKKLIRSHENMLSKNVKNAKSLKESLKARIAKNNTLAKDYVFGTNAISEQADKVTPKSKQIGNYRTAIVANKLGLKTERDLNGKIRIVGANKEQKKKIKAMKKRLDSNKLEDKIVRIMGKYEKIYGSGGKIDASDQVLLQITDYVSANEKSLEIDVDDAVSDIYKELQDTEDSLD